MVKSKASKPPWCSPAFSPLTQTVVSQSEAPKLSFTSRPSQSSGTVNSRWYQSLSPGVIFRWMPESADSATNGTRICSSKESGTPASASVTAKSQMPLRLAQSGRVSCGRGYSGRGLVGSKSSAHGVWIRNSEPLVTGRLSEPTASPPTARSPSPS